MIGIGKWKFPVNMFLYKGDVFLTIEDNNGKYKITPEVPGYHRNDLVYEISNVVERKNTIHVEIASVMIPGNKTVVGDLVFNGNKCTLIADVPIIGHMEFKDGVKVG